MVVTKMGKPEKMINLDKYKTKQKVPANSFKVVKHEIPKNWENAKSEKS